MGQSAGDLDELVKRGVHWVEDTAAGVGKTMLGIQAYILSRGPLSGS